MDACLKERSANNRLAEIIGVWFELLKTSWIIIKNAGGIERKLSQFVFIPKQLNIAGDTNPSLSLHLHLSPVLLLVFLLPL